MKYIKLYEEFERGGRYPLPEKQCRYVNDNYPWINDPSYIKTDGSYYFLGEEIYDTLEEAVNNILEHFGFIDESQKTHPRGGIYKINNGLIDIKGMADISEKNLDKIPFNFGVVTGIFNCSKNNLTSLHGSPIECYDFKCNDNKLTSLEHSPNTVYGLLVMSNNKITSFNGGPKYVGVGIHCENNELTTLEGLPEAYLNITWQKFICSNNKLVSLKNLPNEIITLICDNNNLVTLEGCSTKILSDFDCSNNQLKSLIGGPKHVGDKYNCSHNKLKNLEGAPDYCEGEFNAEFNELVSVAGLKPEGHRYVIRLTNNPDLHDFGDIDYSWIEADNL